MAEVAKVLPFLPLLPEQKNCSALSALFALLTVKVQKVQIVQGKNLQLNECPLVGFELVNCGLLFLHAGDHSAAVTGGFPCHDIMFIAIRATAEFGALSCIGTDVYHNDVPAGRTTE